MKKLYLLAILFASLAVGAAARQAPPGPKTWAVVVGISKYQKLPGGQQLQFADRDAALFSEAIQKHGVSAQNVRLLTGVDATATAIKSAIGNWLARSVSESDTVLIFFSGHGLFEREFGESYLLGYDSDPKDPYSTALSINELGQALARRVRSGRVLVIVDAVRRDFFDPESDPASSKLFAQAFDQLTTARPGLSAIIASGPGEFSREGQRWGGHGVFAKHLADVLFDGAGQTNDLAVTTDGLFELLKGRVAEDTSGKQHPWRSGSEVARAQVASVERKITSPTAVSADVSARPAEEKKPQESGPQPKQPKENAGTPTTSSQQTAVVKPAAKPPARPGPVERPSTTEVKPSIAPQPSRRAQEPAPPRTTSKENRATQGANKEKTVPSPRVGQAEKTGSGAAAVAGDQNAVTTQRGLEKPPSTSAAPKPDATSSNPPSPAAPKPAVPRTVTQAGTDTAKSRPTVTPAPGELARADIPPREAPPTPPKPAVNPPSAVVVSPERGANQPEPLAASVPVVRGGAAPSPLIPQLEAAIASRILIEPRNTSAWDLYQRMLSEPGAAADAARLKPALADALFAEGRAIVSGDVRGDNISDKVDDFKRAGQMLARARTLRPDNGDISALEKLSAAEALISLQFYDEAERALAPLQTAKLAAVENALGLVYQGKLDTWRAERAFKRATEIDSKWAAPHYNLALLYQNQQNQAALGEFEAAASNDQTNVFLLSALGEEYFTRQQWQQAAEAFRKAVALRPTDDNLHTKLGHALYSQGLQDEANREYQKASELRRKRP